MTRLYPPPSDPARARQWRSVADALPRVAAIAAALGGERWRPMARCMESAMQNQAWGYLLMLVHDTRVEPRAFRELFPALPSRPSRREVRDAIREARRAAR
jgi:hypothetical protein